MYLYVACVKESPNNCCMRTFFHLCVQGSGWGMEEWTVEASVSSSETLVKVKPIENIFLLRSISTGKAKIRTHTVSLPSKLH